MRSLVDQGTSISSQRSCHLSTPHSVLRNELRTCEASSLHHPAGKWVTELGLAVRPSTPLLPMYYNVSEIEGSVIRTRDKVCRVPSLVFASKHILVNPGDL